MAHDTPSQCIVLLECIQMRSLKQDLVRYVEAISGEMPVLEERSVSALPLFLRERYQIASAKILGRRFLLALEKGHPDSSSPGEYEQQTAALRSKLGEPVVLVIPAIPSYARNRMVHQGIPFIVPGSQMFLPTALIDLRERFAQSKPEPGKRLTPAAQCVLLYHLQKQSLENLPLKDIAEKVGYSPIMLTKVKDELETAQICTPSKQGRSIVIGFNLHGRKLWGHALDYLSSPVKKSHWLRWDRPAYPAILAGMSALSRRTMLEDDRLPTYALLASTFQANLEKGVYRGCEGPEEADLRLESWSYNPLLLGDERMVDSLSLFLSLRESTDERVQQQLETLIDGMPW